MWHQRARMKIAYAKTHQLRYLDAPVSGGVAAAAAGSLTFMVGGTKKVTLARAMPLLEVMGQKIVHCGDSGAGQAAKICNNMILGITMIGTCEAFALADKLVCLARKCMMWSLVPLVKAGR